MTHAIPPPPNRVAHKLGKRRLPVLTTPELPVPRQGVAAREDIEGRAPKRLEAITLPRHPAHKTPKEPHR